MGALEHATPSFYMHTHTHAHNLCEAFNWLVCAAKPVQIAQCVFRFVSVFMAVCVCVCSL